MRVIESRTETFFLRSIFLLGLLRLLAAWAQPAACCAAAPLERYYLNRW